MRKLFYTAATAVLIGSGAQGLTSCSSSETYADLVNAENRYVNNFVNYLNITDYKTLDEDEVDIITDHVLTDSIHPSAYIDLNQWYRIDEGDFKKLFFKIKSWGNDEAGFKSGKFMEGSNILVRYDSCYELDDDFVNFKVSDKGNNLDPNSYEIIYSWNDAYYASTYYASYYGTGSSYECTSAGLAFPVRFLWAGGEAALIVPFSLSSTADKASYTTLYFGSVKYTKPNYLPQ